MKCAYDSTLLTKKLKFHVSSNKPKLFRKLRTQWYSYTIIVVYDSDDNEDSEDEFLNNDNFEESYKNIV